MTRGAPEATAQWLLAGDASIRWQALRDLAGATARTVEREQRRVARDGWGARLLAKQDPAGTWAGGQSSDGGLYLPKWTSTTYTMLLLRDLGMPAANPQARKACKLLLDEGLQPDGGLYYEAWGRSRSETCVTGMVLSILSHFAYEDDRLDTIADHLLGQQMRDGGWNCRRAWGATHASLHTTISVLEGLHSYERHRALDHFQAVDAPRDPRLADAIDVVRSRRRKDGRWLLEHAYRGKTYFELERLGAPSRWNTLRALRVLRWWDGRRP